MKDDHQKDHLEVGLKTPSGKVFEVIPSEFLWTTLKQMKSQYIYLVQFYPQFNFHFLPLFVWLCWIVRVQK